MSKITILHIIRTYGQNFRAPPSLSSNTTLYIRFNRHVPFCNEYFDTTER
jgi:hypothetical protein